MRLRLWLTTVDGKSFFVPHEDLQRGLTSLVYQVFDAADPSYATWLHNEGWGGHGTPRFKLFSYSRLFGKNRIVNDRGIFFGDPDVHFYFSSPEEHVISLFTAGAVAARELRLCCTRLVVSAVEPLRTPDYHRGALDVVTLSPIIISDSRSSPSGRQRFLLLARQPQLAGRRLEENARLKWLCRGGDPDAFELQLFPLAARDRRVYHAGAGYSFPCSEALLRLKGPPEVLSFVYDCGLGERTGMGYGCLGEFTGGAAA